MLKAQENLRFQAGICQLLPGFYPAVPQRLLAHNTARLLLLDQSHWEDPQVGTLEAKLHA